MTGKCWPRRDNKDAVIADLKNRIEQWKNAFACLERKQYDQVARRREAMEWAFKAHPGADTDTIVWAATSYYEFLIGKEPTE